MPKPETKAYWISQKIDKETQGILGYASYEDYQKAVKSELTESLLRRMKRDGYTLKGKISVQFLKGEIACPDYLRLDATGVRG